jgi:hypothetical protein
MGTLQGTATVITATAMTTAITGAVEMITQHPVMPGGRICGTG